MRLLRKGRLSVVAAVVATAAALSQVAMAALTDLPVTEVKGQKCYYYDVQPRESIYGVSEKLGVTREAILKYNPSAADGLKPRMRLFFPVAGFAEGGADRGAVYSAAAGVKTHLVKKGETLYGIARKYGMSPDRLAELNPHVSDGLRAGDTLTINADEEAARKIPAQPVTVDGEGFAVYEIKPGDTLFSIANSYGVPLEAILDANPAVDPLHYNVAVAENAAPENEGGVYLGEEEVAEVAEPMNVAVLLPFMLGEEQQSRTTQLYTEFYKGMLMAADSLRNVSGTPVNFRFYDTASSIDTVRTLLCRPEIECADMLVAPDNSAQLAAIMDKVSDETLVLNIFAVKDESYKNYRNLIQTNIPHDAMYRKAIDMFMDKYSDAMPVFISRSAGQADKDSFTSELKKRLDEQGREYKEIQFNVSLSDDDLSGLDVDSRRVVFVPNSGSKTEFARFIKPLTSLRENAVDSGNVTIFGYPEWVTFRGESFDEICALDATIYSRYLSTDVDPATRELKQRYKDWYGVEMFEAVPTQGILGFDTGMYIIRGLRQLDETGVFPEENAGVQSNMKLVWSGNAETDANGDLSTGGGLVNDALYLINYRPGGTVEWEN